MVASQQSNITSTSTTIKTTEPMPPPRRTTAIGKTTSNVNPTVSTPAPVLTDAVQKCVDTAAEAIAIHREAKMVFMQGLVKRILREAYREPIIPPSAGTPLAQSVFAGIPSTSRGPYPPFVTHPNYYNGLWIVLNSTFLLYQFCILVCVNGTFTSVFIALFFQKHY